MPKPEKDRVPVEPEASDENEAIRAEAAEMDDPTDEATPVVRKPVEFDGQTWMIDTDGDGWPMDAGIAYAKILNNPDDQPPRVIQYLGEFLEAVMGPAQWARFKRGRRTKDMWPMFDAVMVQAFGAGSGE